MTIPLTINFKMTFDIDGWVDENGAQMSREAAFKHICELGFADLPDPCYVERTMEVVDGVKEV